MKKLLLMTGAVLVLGLAMAGLAYANGGPHGGYTPTTDACAGCHRAHTASGPNLLIEASTWDLCMTCHGNTGSGADTNVLGGIYTNREGGGEGAVGNGLNGGGFEYAYDPTNTTFEAVTSVHTATGVITQAWGAGGTIGVAGDLYNQEPFDCASCHDPHGSTNYRIILESVNNTAVAAPLVDESAKDYTDEDWDYGDTGDADASVSQLCAACHGPYHATAAGSGSTSPYTHRIDMSYSYGSNQNPETNSPYTYTLPLANSVDVTGTQVTTDTIVLCTTCHLAHGSSAQQGAYSEGATLPDVPGGSGDSSALLRLDNRGVCEVCHQK